MPLSLGCLLELNISDFSIACWQRFVISVACILSISFFISSLTDWAVRVTSYFARSCRSFSCSCLLCARSCATSFAIEKSEMFERPKLNGINRLSNNGIRLQCQSPEEADQLHKINWNVAFEGLRIHKPNYGITVHGVPKTDINFNDETDLKEIIRKLEKANASRGIPINKIAPLRRKPRTDDKPSKNHSIVVFTEDLHAANTCIRMGFYINHQRYLAEKYAPQFHLTQCYKCFDYGHRASHCKRKQKGGKCGENHPNIDSCQSTEARCTSCNGNHHPWSIECPERRAESRRLRALRLQMNPFSS